MAEYHGPAQPKACDECGMYECNGCKPVMNGAQHTEITRQTQNCTHIADCCPACAQKIEEMHAFTQQVALIMAEIQAKGIGGMMKMMMGGKG